MNRTWKWCATVLLMVTLLLCATPLTLATGDTREIKVGYVPNYGTMLSPAVNGAQGYGYEYFTEIAQHMEEDTTVAFVNCTTWEDGLAMLDQGTIDVLGPTSNMGLEGYVYSVADFGESHMLLATLDSEEAYYGDYDAFQGATIGIPQYYAQSVDVVTAFLEDKGISANLVMVASSDLVGTLESGFVEYVFMSSFQTQVGLQAVARIGIKDAYYIARDADLMADIDTAMERIKEEEFLYQTRLYAKYVDYGATAKVHITDEEHDLLQEKGTYTVGVRNFESSLCRADDNGVFSGSAFDVLEAIADDAGITFTYVELEPDAPQELYDQVDMLMIDTTKADEYGFSVCSDPYIQLPLLLLESKEKDTQSEKTIGVADYYQINVNATDGMLYGRQVMEYSTVSAMREAFVSGDVDSILLTVSALNVMQEDLASMTYRTETLDIDLSVCLAFSKRVTGDEIAVFNKLISRLDATTVDASVIANSTSVGEDGIVIYVWHHPVILFAMGLVIMLVIVLVERRRRKALDTIVNVDTLTGLMTEHKFMEEAEKLLALDRTEPYSLVSVDVDNFKYINEIYGYEAGTQLLQLVGQKLQQKATDKTLLAHGVADNFLVLAPETVHRDVVSTIGHDVEEIQNAMGALIGKNYKLYFSFGVYRVEACSIGIARMIDYANIARQAGKGKIGTSVYDFTDEMKVQQDNSNYFTSIMEQALSDEEFILQYQPKVSLETGVMVGAEALVRWKRAAGNMPPYQFIPLFEKNGFIEQLDYYVLGKACAFLVAHPDFHQGRISVNLSSASLLEKQVTKNLIAIVERYGVSPQLLDLEVTESALVDDEEALDKLQILRQYGFTISIDDFGVGVSSLNRLKNMDVDVLKIDRAFIMDALENPRGHKILQHVLEMAKSLELETVAEGIETQEQSTLLKNMGCHVGQGYHYARPMDEVDFVAYYQQMQQD